MTNTMKQTTNKLASALAVVLIALMISSCAAKRTVYVYEDFPPGRASNKTTVIVKEGRRGKEYRVRVDNRNRYNKPKGHICSKKCNGKGHAKGKGKGHNRYY